MISKIKDFISKQYLKIKYFKSKREDKLTFINLPTCYNLNNQIIPAWVVDDIKSQTLERIQSNPNFKKRVTKSGKLLVKFEVKTYNLKHSPRWSRSIYLCYLDNQLYDAYGQDKIIWEREKKLKQLLGE